ncbi:MAG: TetR family transcriptional regulator [Acidimicrobiales bacterium]|nr:MAG: TetR family transcriptional regulator [Acidimicrobiales bacterium]
MLPVLGQPAAERSDAARNRQALLAVAQTIVASSGVAALSMDGLAAQAGVGVGTVYRRFKDRAGLAYALLDHGERRFQEEFLFGSPPLGPGAPPIARIRAFLHAYIDRLDTQAELHLFAECHAPTARFRSGAYQTHRAHLALLLTQARPDISANYLADALLALLGAGLFLHQRRELHLTTNQMKAGLDQLLNCLDAATEPNATRTLDAERH